MQSIQIWRALPEETNPDNLIGDIHLISDTSNDSDTILAKLLWPQNLAGQTLRIPGYFGCEIQPYSARNHVRELAVVLDRDYSARATEPMLDVYAGSHPLSLKVFDCRQGQRELTQLTIVPHAEDPFLCEAAWSSCRDEMHPVVALRFLPFAISPWTVLRVATHLLRVGNHCGADVAAFHYTTADDFSALPGNRGWK